MSLNALLLNRFWSALRAADALPSETALAREFNVSRSTVRESLSELMAAGLISKQQGRHTRLVNPMERLVLSRPVIGDPSIQEVKDVLELRAFLESVAAGCCAESASDDQLAIIKSEYEKMQLRNEKNTTLSRAKADLQFHMLIAQFSHNLVVASLSELFYSRYFSSIYKALDLTLQRYGRYPDKIAPQHEQIFKALCQRDRLAAETAAREHVLYTRSLL